MRTETFEVIKALEQYKDNEMAQHFVGFIRGSKDKDAAADEVRELMVETATQAVSLVQDMGLVDSDTFYTEEAKRVIGAARRMCRDVEVDGTQLSWKMHGDSTSVFDLNRAVKDYESKVLRAEAM